MKDNPWIELEELASREIISEEEDSKRHQIKRLEAFKRIVIQADSQLMLIAEINNKIAELRERL